jgi:hypothetical protein
MVLQRAETIGREGMQSIVRYMMGVANRMYEGAEINIFGTRAVPGTSNYQRSNDIRFEVLGKRMIGYLQETGRDPVNLDLALLDEGDRGYKFFHSMSLAAGELEKILKGK